MNLSLRRSSHFVFALAIAATLAVPSLTGQSTFGSILGTVHDQSGAVVADCVVSITNKEHPRTVQPFAARTDPTRFQTWTPAPTWSRWRRKDFRSRNTKFS